MLSWCGNPLTTFSFKHSRGGGDHLNPTDLVCSPRYVELKTLLKSLVSATWKHVAESGSHVAESPSATWVCLLKALLEKAWSEKFLTPFSNIGHVAKDGVSATWLMLLKMSGKPVKKNGNPAL
ncbi:hypothetical protein SLEP1_g10928 [Rubroshorea leprosula]|uniref:Uncharacterized protein n=1 Tax=Rubroshorea leprosula TaxID=152421 RepID=A0AAV5II61_9ROSI|nr:hypothetical protein SLEP1_g10928 [Rubroshorea leprosula]